MTVAPALVQVEFRSPRGPRVARTTSRRRSAGIHSAAGSTSSLPSWWTPEDWLAEVYDALVDHRDLCRVHHIQADTAYAVAQGMAAYADFRTGRDCRPTNERLVADAQVSLSTVQRARRVLKALGFVVELVAGRSVLTRQERLAAHQRGSSHRRIAAEFALCSRRERPAVARVLPRRRRGVRGQVVDGDTPPGSPIGREESSVRRTHLRTTAETRKAPPGPAPTHKIRPGGRRRVDPRTRRLVAGVLRRLGWLAGVSAARLTPLLARFATADWTPRDVERAVVDALAARGWKLPRDLDHPVGYLAMLLREVDHEDRPGALDEYMAAVEAAQRAYDRLLAFGPPCEHGQPGGAVPSPRSGTVACPLCRVVVWPEVVVGS